MLRRLLGADEEQVSEWTQRRDRGLARAERTLDELGVGAESLDEEIDRRAEQVSVSNRFSDLLDRLTEPELFPCLRAHGLKYAAYMPLASCFLTEQFALPGAGAPLPSKFDRAFWAHADFYTTRYFPGAPAVAELKDVAAAHGLTLTEVALRWLQWHSQLQPGDHGIVVGANKIEHLQTTLADR